MQGGTEDHGGRCTGRRAAYLTGEMMEELGFPQGTSMILTAIVSGGVTYSAERYFFKDATGKVIAECTQDELEKVVKGEMDNIIPDVSAVKGSAVDDVIKGGTGTSWVDFMSPEDAARYNNWVALREVGLDQAKINDIILSNKGYRPNPTTYLSPEYIKSHLALFDDGASIIMTKEQYITYVKGSDYIGIPSDGTQFVLPKSYCDNIAASANGNISIYEQALGFDIGHFEDGGGLVRIDIEILDDLNLRMPSGNEAGVNNHWIPGGITDGGIPEAITDLIPNIPENVTITQIE